MRKIPDIEAFLKMQALSTQAGFDDSLFTPIRDKLQITNDFIDAYNAANEYVVRVPLVLHALTDNAQQAFLNNCRSNGIKTFFYASSDNHTLTDLSEFARHGAVLRGVLAVEIEDDEGVKTLPAIRIRVN